MKQVGNKVFSRQFEESLRGAMMENNNTLMYKEFFYTQCFSIKGII